MKRTAATSKHESRCQCADGIFLSPQEMLFIIHCGQQPEMLLKFDAHLVLENYRVMSGSGSIGAPWKIAPALYITHQSFYQSM